MIISTTYIYIYNNVTYFVSNRVENSANLKLSKEKHLFGLLPQPNMKHTIHNLH